MALELQLSTAKAQKALDDFEKALSNAQAKMTAFNAAMKNSGTASASFASSASQSSRAVSAQAKATNTAAGSANRYASGVKKADAATRTFGSTMATARTAIMGLGVAMGGLALGRAVKGAWDLNNAFQRINILFTEATGKAEGGAQAIDFIKDVARKTAVDIDALAQSYSTFGINAVKAGFSVEKTNKIFTTLATTMRVLNLSAEQSKRTFKGFEQIINKGTFSMEEIRQQIGENIPAMKALEKATGMMGKELQDAMKKGAVGIEYLEPLMNQFTRQYGKLLPEALNTTQAQMTRVTNEIKIMGQEFMKPVFDALKQPLKDIADALYKVNEEGSPVVSLMRDALAGAVQIAAQGIALLVQNLDLIVPVLGLIAARWTVLMTLFAGKVFVAQTVAALQFFNVIKNFPTLMTTLATAFTAGGTASTVLATGLRLLGVALRFVLGAVTGTIIGVAALAAGYAAYLIVSGQAEQLTKMVGAAIEWIAGMFGMTKLELTLLIKSWVNWASEMISSNAVVKAVGGAIKWLGDTLSWLWDEVKKLAKAVRDGFIEAWNAAKAAVSGAASSIRSAVSSIISAVQRAIRYLKELLGLQRKTGSGGGGNTTAPAAKQGGISHKMHRTNPSQTVPSSAFVGAPHFADGGVTGGGIPAILHPNEAVIPLKNGAVPVDLSGVTGGAPSASTAQSMMTGNPLQDSRAVDNFFDAGVGAERHLKSLMRIGEDQKTILRNIIVNIGEQGKIMANKLDKVCDTLQSGLSQISNAVGRISVSGGGGGGGGGGSISYSGGGGGGGGGYSKEELKRNPYLDPQYVKDRLKLGEELSKRGNTFSANGIGAMTFGSDQAKLAREAGVSFEDFAKMTNLSKYRLVLPAGATGGGPGTGIQIDGAWAQYKEAYESGRSYGMATGTANTSKDARFKMGLPGPTGGRMVELHGNEAVIPLSGGAVPVQMSGGGGGGITVVMNINTADAESFRRSKKQLTQEMAVEMRNVQRQIGRPSGADLTSKNPLIDKSAD